MLVDATGLQAAGSTGSGVTNAIQKAANATGVSFLFSDLVSKHLGLLRELLPRLAPPKQGKTPDLIDSERTFAAPWVETSFYEGDQARYQRGGYGRGVCEVGARATAQIHAGGPYPEGQVDRAERRDHPAGFRVAGCTLDAPHLCAGQRVFALGVVLE